jgi:hypothetical protein
MSKKHDAIMEELRMAKPAGRNVPPGWAEGARADEILAEVLAGSETAEKPGPGRRLLTSTRLAWGGALLLVAALALITGAHYLAAPAVPTRTPAAGAVVTTLPGPANFSPPAREQVLRQDALAEIVTLAYSLSPTATGSPSAWEQPADLVRAASSLSVLRAAEGPDYLLGQPVTRLQFALWLWRASVSLLPRRLPLVNLSDLGTLGLEERVAIQALLQAGVIVAKDGDAFLGDKVLTEAEETLYLTRLREVVAGATR